MIEFNEKSPRRVRVGSKETVVANFFAQSVLMTISTLLENLTKFFVTYSLLSLQIVVLNRLLPFFQVWKL
jgi:hypothetical protein